MKILVACEFSGTVRDAFIAKGHDAISCDLLPTESPVPHYQGDVMDILNQDYDMLIAHPPCTYLCVPGAHYLHTRPERWELMEQARSMFMQLLSHNVDKVCIENPLPHRYAKLPRYTQIIQPWQFGHGETKATCLWLKNLPKLIPTKIVSGRDTRIHYMPPGKDRSKLRSKTYQGIADAMADQWG